MGLDGWLVNVSWLEKLVSVFWMVELDFFSLGCNEVYSNEFRCLCVWCDFGQPVYCSGLFLCCWRISVLCLALELVGPWVVLVSV